VALFRETRTQGKEGIKAGQRRFYLRRRCEGETSMKNPFKRWSFGKISGPLRAMRLRRNARQDEQNGFLFAAAMEWREAAELCASTGLLADICWLEWERIMRLPRQMAAPIEDRSIADIRTARPKSANLTGQHAIKSPASVLAAVLTDGRELCRLNHAVALISRFRTRT
jgi:hypothetical protein